MSYVYKLALFKNGDMSTLLKKENDVFKELNI